MQSLSQQDALKLFMLLPEPASPQLTTSEAHDAATKGIQAEAPLIRHVLGLSSDADVGVSHLLQALPAAITGLQRAWVAFGATPNSAAGCAVPLLEAAMRLRSYAPLVRLLVGGVGAASNVLEWLTPLEAVAAAITAATLEAPSAPALLQLLLSQLLPVLPADDGSAEAAVVPGHMRLPSQQRLLSCVVWSAVYNDQGPCVAAVWPIIIRHTQTGVVPSRGRTALAVATMLGHSSALAALLGLTPALGEDWGRCLVQLALRTSTWRGARNPPAAARCAVLHAMATSGMVPVPVAEVEEAVAGAVGAGVLGAGDAEAALQQWREAAEAVARGVHPAASVATSSAAPCSDAPFSGATCVGGDATSCGLNNNVWQAGQQQHQAVPPLGLSTATAAQVQA